MMLCRLRVVPGGDVSLYEADFGREGGGSPFSCGGRSPSSDPWRGIVQLK